MHDEKNYSVEESDDWYELVFEAIMLLFNDLSIAKSFKLNMFD